MYTNLPTSQSYIFRILQHFATKLCSFSNFDNFFPKISFVIPRLKIFLKRKSSINLLFSLHSYLKILPVNIKNFADQALKYVFHSRLNTSPEISLNTYFQAKINLHAI
jgi:hypothetical protein